MLPPKSVFLALVGGLFVLALLLLALVSGRKPEAGPASTSGLVSNEAVPTNAGFTFPSREASPETETAAEPAVVSAATALSGSDGVTVAAEGEAGSESDAADGSAGTSAAQDRAMQRIDEAVVTYEASALPVLAPFLVHEDPVLREAAREGVVQMGLSEGAPVLREAAGKLKDPREAILLLDAADFLELPSIPSLGRREKRSLPGPPERRTDSPPPRKSTDPQP